jgi:hypothetical protein
MTDQDNASAPSGSSGAFSRRVILALVVIAVLACAAVVTVFKDELLYDGATSADGLIAELKAAGTEIAWLRMEFYYPSGWPDTFEGNIEAGFVDGSFRLRGAPAL